MSSRNEITAALLERLREEIPEVKTWLRRPCVLETVPVEQHPAAYLVLDGQDADPEPRPKWTIRAGVYIVASSTAPEGPRELVNELVYAVETACARKAYEVGNRSGFWTTLGDKVFAVRPTHADIAVPMTPAGVEGDKGMAFVDLEIIAPG